VILSIDISAKMVYTVHSALGGSGGQ